ncbi:MAG TPA: helix-turn-helix domain-containing protein [Candidatus Acidoferrales bacterium]|nr:helix-turn-helix domain-containing protein [Candidatus Acidoferrales bacterium]
MATVLAERPARADPRVTRTRRLIRDALVSLLAEKSFESITVQDIAERATVNRATFYAHFTDKFALLEAIVREDVAERLAQGDPLRERDARAMLLLVANSVFAFVGSHRNCRVDRDFEPQFERAIEAQVTEFLLARFEHCTAKLIASALVGAAMTWRHHAPKQPYEPIATHIVAILLDGVEKYMAAETAL